jgi:Rps23 Pro-64 3,4-dihydroxylase Tpa1-like proline 4-hydroxylase
MNSSFLIQKNENYRQVTPWTHYVIDNFLPQKMFNKIQKSLCAVSDGYKKRDNDLFDLNYMFLPDLNLAKLFLSADFKTFLESVTGEKLEIYEGSLVQLRLMTPNSPAMPPHVDDQDQRSLVCLWYLADWVRESGGELNLLKSESSLATDPSSKIIEPVANRMVLFFSDDTNWHSVNKVHNWNRYSVISEWLVKG